VSAALRTVALRRTLGRGDAASEILHGIDLEIGRGEFCSIMGPSGSGKSTLMYLLGALDRPSAGAVEIDGVDTARLSESDPRIRNAKVGFVFQFHYLMPFTAPRERDDAQPGRGRWRAGRGARARAARAARPRSEARSTPGRFSGGEHSASRRAQPRQPAARRARRLSDREPRHENGESVSSLRAARRQEGETIKSSSRTTPARGRTHGIVRLQDAPRRRRPAARRARSARASVSSSRRHTAADRKRCRTGRCRLDPTARSRQHGVPPGVHAFLRPGLP
jgi:predicted ABC-type transport system involved in lysophospholipase L1 biosynthesis ATPase subunit